MVRERVSAPERVNERFASPLLLGASKLPTRPATAGGPI